MDEKQEAEFTYEIVNNKLRPIADRLVEKFDELHHIDVEKILFVLNYKSAKNKRRITLANTARVPEKWAQLLYQLGGYNYKFVIEIYAKTTAAFDENQMVALLYRELRRIGMNGEILTPDVQDWWQMLMGLGRKWFYPDASCPNLLDDENSWKKLMGSYYSPEDLVEQEQK